MCGICHVKVMNFEIVVLNIGGPLDFILLVEGKKVLL